MTLIITAHITETLLSRLPFLKHPQLPHGIPVQPQVILPLIPSKPTHLRAKRTKTQSSNTEQICHSLDLVV